MDVSLIICTYRRPASLKRMLESLCLLDVPRGLAWELLVVDNNSRDETSTVCEAFSSRLPLRYLFAAKQGKSCALNCGVKEAQGELLLFTDDDVTLDPGWIMAYAAAAGRHPEAAYFGGRTLPAWEKQPPQWLQEHSASLLSCISLHDDRGMVERPLAHDPFVRGCNMAIRKCVFEAGRYFDEEIGPFGRRETRGEDFALIAELIRAGLAGCYVPHALLYHMNPGRRSTERYVRQWFAGHGAVSARLDARAGRNGWSVARLWYARRLVALTARFLIARGLAPSAEWLAAEIELAQVYGYVRESWALNRSRRTGSRGRETSNG